MLKDPLLDESDYDAGEHILSDDEDELIMGDDDEEGLDGEGLGEMSKARRSFLGMQCITRKELKASCWPPPGLVAGDADGLFSQLLGGAIQLMLITTTCQKTCGFTPDILAEKVIPGATFTYFLGNSIFGWWGQHQSRKTGRAGTCWTHHTIHPLYTLYTPTHSVYTFITVYVPIYNSGTCVYNSINIIYTPNTPLNTL